MSNLETDLDRYCPLRTDVNGEMRKCVKGCAWWWNGSCSVARISFHLELLQDNVDMTGIYLDDLKEVVSDLNSELDRAHQTDEQEVEP